MATLKDINTLNWQLAVAHPGIATGSEDVKQCIATILFTRKGSDPLRPNFGCGIADQIDKPVNSAIPGMKKDIIEAITTFEKRVTITKIIAEFYND